MKKLFLIFGIAMLALLGACKDDDNNNEGEGKATLKIKLVDAPAAYDAVNVEIIGMKAKLDSVWVDLPVAEPGVYNLLEFTNGNSLPLIGETLLDPATMSELRLILGDENSIIVDSVTAELQTPSGQTSGYKIKMDPQVLAPGTVYSLVIDFDVNKSVHPTGQGKYILQPVVNGYLETSVGGISGTIAPVDGASYVEAVIDTTSYGTYIDQATGQFLIPAVPPGTYDVTFTANTGYQNKTVPGIVVVSSQVTDMGVVTIDPE